MNYSDFNIIYYGAPSNANSTLLTVAVYNVSAPDLLNCQDGDLNVSKFEVYNSTDDSPVFWDHLQYNGTHWAALNYSLLTIANLSQLQNDPRTLYVKCYFQRNSTQGDWSLWTAESNTFVYEHSLFVDEPTFTYIADTSYTIDVYVSYIRSSIWGLLNAVSSNTLTFTDVDDGGNFEVFNDVLSYNSTYDRWQVDELDIRILDPGVEYKVRAGATYAIKYPPQTVLGGNSQDTFVYLAPYLDIDDPVITYVGRDVQNLSITVASVWDSVHGYLIDANMTLTNFSIWHVATSAIVLNGTFSWNDTGEYWYVWNFDVNASLDLGDLDIGEVYNITAHFNVSITSERGAIRAMSAFSAQFIIDRDPPELLDIIINEGGNDPPTDEDDAEIVTEISDDARISMVILSYYNGTHWLNVTMRGRKSVLTNYTATIPVFPERFMVFYRIYANDSQDQWYVSPIYNYTVADTPPLIAYLLLTPETPLDADPVTVRVNVTDGTSVKTVTLYYSFDGVNYASITMTHIGGHQYEAIIPAFPSAMPYFQFNTVLFRVEATDYWDNLRTSTTYAYHVQGSLPGIDPLSALMLLSAVAITIAVVIVLIKIYERY
jgi:hypothetical protein